MKETGLLGLTSRELEVLERLAHGETDQGIAASIGISWHTVRFHVKKLKIKLDVRTRTELATWFGRHESLL